MASDNEEALILENADLRTLLTQSGLDVAALVAKAGIDAEANETARRLQRLLLEEMHHRLKNTLATVMAVASQSLRTAVSLNDGRLAVENRILALGRGHDLLLEANWAAADLSEIVRGAIGPFNPSDETRFDVAYVSLQIGAESILPFVLSINELCTNAVKYGALSNKVGRVAIQWNVKDSNVHFSWKESGGPLVTEPSRRGFGSRLIDRLAAQMKGKITLTYRSEGFFYELNAPMKELQKQIA